jgi:hypothetical protein
MKDDDLAEFLHKIVTTLLEIKKGERREGNRFI